MSDISINTLKVNRIGTFDPNNPHIPKIELEIIFNVDKSRLIAYQIFNAENVRIQTVRNRFYNKGETLYATIRETSFYDPALMPREEYGADGQVRLVAWLIDGNNQRISDMATSILNITLPTPEKIEQYEQLVESLKTPEEITTPTKPFEKPERKKVFQSVKDIEEAFEFLPEASAQVQQELGTFGLSQETQNIIDDWGTKKIIIPSWFVNNNMQWVLEGKISEQEFLAGYQNLVNTGIITYPDEPTKLITTNFQVIIQDVTRYSTSLSNEDYKRLQDEMMLEPRVTLVFLNQTDFKPLGNNTFTKELLKIQGLLPVIPPPPSPLPPPSEPNANMVRQEIGRFQIVNKTLRGKITYIATDNFDEHFYYNFENNSGYILKCYVIATDSSGNVLLSKQNDLRFSETERDETITISDYVDTEENKITVEFYVTNTPTPDSFEDDFAFIRTITTPYFPKKQDTLFGALFGLIAIPTALTLLGTKT